MKQAKYLLSSLLVLIMLLGASAAYAGTGSFPKIIPLPDGFRPEGIMSGYGTDFYAGSLENGAIYKGDFRTGKGDILVAGEPGRIAVGLAFDERTGYLFVSGGTTGSASVYDTTTGMQMGFFQFTGPGASFVNDATVTQGAVYFTDSFNARLFKVPLSPTGALPDPSTFETLTLHGEWMQVPGFNANGIDSTPDDRTLFVVNSTEGKLYTVDPSNGYAMLIDLDGGPVTNGDGILMDGYTLYVLRNQLNLIAVVELAPDFSSGKVVDEITDSAFRVPTTLTELGNRLYAVNARFGTPPGPDVDYDVVQVLKH